MTLTKRCKNCDYKDENNLCNRFPPTPIKSTVKPNSYEYVNPQVEDDDFCGEFKFFNPSKTKS